MLLLALLALPLLAALLTFVTGKSYRIIEAIAVVMGVLQGILVIVLAAKLVDPSYFKIAGYFSFDALSVYMLSLISIVVFFTTWYAIGYFRKEVEKGIIGFRRFREFYGLFHLSILAMFVAVATVNPIILWVAIEATSLASVFLVSFYNKPSGTEAAWKYLIINTLALLLAFLGTTILSAAAYTSGVEGIMTWETLTAAATHIDPLVAKLAFVFILVGYGTKIGWAPMHTWKPDVYSKAPTPLVALMASAFFAVAWYGILRFTLVGNAVGVSVAQFINHAFLIFGIASVVIGSLIMMTQKNYKRFLAYSSIEHAGLIALGFGIGNIFGIYASLLHLLYHTLAKPLAFMGAGNIFLKYGSTKLTHIRGLSRIAPVTALIFALACVTLMGLPPFGIFASELTLLLAAFAAHPIIAGVILLCLVIAFIATLRIGSSMLSGEPTEGVEKGDTPWMTLIPALLLALVLLTISLWLPAWFPALFQTIISAFSS